MGSHLAVVLAVIASVLIVLLVVGLIWYLIPIFSSKEELTITQRKNVVQGLASVVQALAVVLTGTVGLIGVFFTWQTLQDTRESQRKTQESTERTLQLTEQGQITERFTRAIDQLGNESLELRLGGVYALEQITKESEVYHWPIMEILTAYVRQNASRGTIQQQQGKCANEVPTPKPDIQAIMTVIGRRQRYWGQGEREQLDLHNTHLPRINRMAEAKLQGVILKGANLQEANLWHVYLDSADLERANLQGAILDGARLGMASLASGDLRGAFLRETILESTYLGEAKLQGASFEATVFKEATVHGAYFDGAILKNADLQGALGLTQKQLDKAVGDERTKIPDHFRRPPSWSKKPDN